MWLRQLRSDTTITYYAAMPNGTANTVNIMFLGWLFSFAGVDLNSTQLPALTLRMR
jgi:hypothetical protein